MGRLSCWLVLLLLSACGRAPSGGERAGPSLREVLGPGPSTGFSPVLAPRQFRFPGDHGPHRAQRTEWWYLVGHLDSDQGARFGYQLTVFRFGLAARPAPRSSAWAASELYLSHLAVTDLATATHRSFERLARGAAGLAGAVPEPFALWIGDWRLAGKDSADSFPWRLQARQGGIGLDLLLAAGKPPVLHGAAGLSAKGREPGQASYYYSLTRLPTRGELALDGRRFRVSGESWLDREWSSSLLGARQVGWDWFALQLEGERELMLFQLRRADGSVDWSGGTLVSPDGSAAPIPPGELSVVVTDRWRSRSTGVAYPSAWQLTVAAAQIDLAVRPLVADQELDLSFRYWEGAVTVAGAIAGEPVAGRGYVELVGY